jgi:hypothetical protein
VYLGATKNQLKLATANADTSTQAPVDSQKLASVLPKTSSKAILPKDHQASSPKRAAPTSAQITRAGQTEEKTGSRMVSQG